MDHSPGFLRLVDSIRGTVIEITPEQAVERQAAGARLIDVREDREWNEAHPAGATHVGRGVIERDIERLVPDPSSELLLMCGGGFRSALATDSLQKMGYTNVRSVAGGWRGWQEAGLPVERAETLDDPTP